MFSKNMHSMRVVPREKELIRPVPEYSQYSGMGRFFYDLVPEPDSGGMRIWNL